MANCKVIAETNQKGGYVTVPEDAERKKAAYS